MNTLKVGQKVRVNKNYAPALAAVDDGSMRAMQGKEGVVVQHESYYVDVRIGGIGQQGLGRWLFEPRELDLL